MRYTKLAQMRLVAKNLRRHRQRSKLVFLGIKSRKT
jgi:hypothetical protein